MKLKKLWIFLAGLCGIFVIYLTVATVAVFMVLDRIEAETGSGASLFGNWYQTLLFVADIVFVLGMAAFIVLAVLTSKKKAMPVASTEEGKSVESV